MRQWKKSGAVCAVDNCRQRRGSMVPGRRIFACNPYILRSPVRAAFATTLLCECRLIAFKRIANLVCILARADCPTEPIQ